MDQKLIDEIADAAAAALDDNRPDVVAAAHARGALTARERIGQLTDPGSFIEYGILAGRTSAADDDAPADGLVCGSATVHDLPVIVAATDRSVVDGTQSDRNQRKLARLLQIAVTERWPVVLLLDGDGARPGDPLPPPPIMVAPRGRYGLFDGLAELNGRAPTVACVLGRSLDAEAGAAMLCDCSIALADAPIGTRTADGLVTRPAAEYVSRGDIDLLAADEAAAIAAARRYLSFHLPDAPDGPVSPDYPHIADIVPENRRRPYDMRRLVAAFADADSTLELQPDYGRSMLTILARLNGRARPLASLHARDVPLCSVQVRKAYGLGPYAMSGWGSSRNAPLLKLAWPSVESGGMSLEGAAYLVKRKEIQAAASASEALEIRNAYADRMRESTTGVRAGRTYQFDDIIRPDQTRERISGMLARIPRRRPVDPPPVDLK
ncbi:MAG: carboxyl transferase domain-containing protein [Gammaproteobacteria bacterium]